jgi:hypothetical protein
MGIPVESVAVGKCYLTEIGQVRRVLEIKEAMVKYESSRKDSARRIMGRLHHRKHCQVCPGCRTRSPRRLRSILRLVKIWKSKLQMRSRPAH